MESIFKSSFNWKVSLLLLALTLTIQLSCSAPRNRSTSSSYPGRSSSKTGRSKGRTHPSGVAIKQKSPCSALIDGRLIDLTPLGDTSFKPGYAVEVGGWTYSFNPCFPFNVPENPYTGLQDQCDFVAMCQSKETPEGHVAYTMGIQRTTSFILHPPPGVNLPEVTSRPPEMTSQGDADLWIDSDPKIDVDPLNKDSEGSNEESEEGKKGEAKEETEEEEDDEEEENKGEEGEEEHGETGGKEEGVGSENMETGSVQKRGQEVEEGPGEEGTGDEEQEGSGQYEDEEGEDDEDDEEDEDDEDDDMDDDEDEEEEEEEELEDPTPKRVRSGSKRQRRVQSLGDGKNIESIRDKREIKDRSRQRNQRRRARKRKTPMVSPMRNQDNSSLVEIDEDEAQSPSVDQTTKPEGVTQTLSDELTTQRPRPDTTDGTSRTKTKKSKRKKVSSRKSKTRKSVPVPRTPGEIPALRLNGIRTLMRQRTFIFLVCDTKILPRQRANFTFLHRQHRTLYFELRHICCCPDACTTDRVLMSASRDQMSATEKEARPSFWPPHQLLWVVVAVFVIIFIAIVIGTACCRTGGARGPYTMLPGIHSSRLTMSSMDSVRFPHKLPSPDYLDYTSPKLKQAQLPQVENGIVHANDLEIGQRLGGGLFGDTYIGEFRDRTISVKRITVGVHQGQLTEADRAQLADDVSDFSRLQHRHIVLVIGICLDTRQPHIVKEYVDGESLRMLLQQDKDGSLTYTRKLKMLTQAADGMTYLHSSKINILHRDFRCANLLVSEADDLVKITDFGMVRLLHRLRVQCTGREGCYCRKSTPSFPASIRWTAPEVLRHPTSEETLSEVFGPPCDVFSFGMTLWEAMNSSDPWYEFPREEDVMDVVLRGGRPEESLAEGAPDAHVGLMRACWIETPEKRPTFKQIHSHMTSLVKQAAKGERKRRDSTASTSTMTYFRSALNISTQ